MGVQASLNTLFAKYLLEEALRYLFTSNDNAYIFEFKISNEGIFSQPKQKILRQINKNKIFISVGINFDKNERNTSNFNWKII